MRDPDAFSPALGGGRWPAALAACLLLGGWCAPALGQDAPPGEPQDPQGATPAEPEPSGGGGEPRGGGGGGGGRAPDDPHGGGDGPHGGGRGGLELPDPPPSSAQPDSSLAAGTVRVEVTDVAGRPLAGEHVELGTMAQQERRERRSGTTGADGTFTWSGLPTGSEQAYRVMLSYRGARFGAEPFQLPPGRGYRVRVARNEVTRSGQKVILFAGRTSVEVRDERLSILQELQLVNFGEETWVLPRDGVRLALPPGFTAFQTEPSMSDLRASTDENGVVLAGSIQPGESRVVFQFHLPYSARDLDLRIPIPFRTVIYEVLVEAAQGMTAEAEGFPDLEEFESDGRRILGGRLTRGPTSPPFDVLEIRLRGIPGPGGGRWVAAALALLLAAGGLSFALRSSKRDDPVRVQLGIDRERAAILAQLEQLEESRGRGDVGPKTYERRRDELVRELASLLRESAAVRGGRAKA